MKIVTLLLVLVVVAVTTLNSYTTRMNCELYMSGVEHNNNELVRTKIVQNVQAILADKDAQLEKIVEVAKSEAERADNIQGEFNGLIKQYVQLRNNFNAVRMDLYNLQQAMAAIGGHIRECHKLLEANGITPPAISDEEAPMPVQPLQPGSSNEPGAKSSLGNKTA